MQHLNNISFRTWNSSVGIPSPPLALFVVMLPKAHLTSHSRMSGSRWVKTPSWLSGSLRSLLYSSVYSCHLLISIASEMVHTFSVLYSAHLCMKCSIGISNFLKEISILSHSFFPSIFFLIVHLRGFSYISLLFFGTLHLNGYIFPSLLCSSLLCFSQLFIRAAQIVILLFCISFSWELSWSLSPVQCHGPLSIVHQALCLPD